MPSKMKYNISPTERLKHCVHARTRVQLCMYVCARACEGQIPNLVIPLELSIIYIDGSQIYTYICVYI